MSCGLHFGLSVLNTIQSFSHYTHTHSSADESVQVTKVFPSQSPIYCNNESSLNENRHLTWQEFTYRLGNRLDLEMLWQNTIVHSTGYINA